MRGRSRTLSADYWPGFVDALTTLLLVIIFLLVVFVLAQVVLSQAISGKDAALDRLNRQVQELADLLDLERQANVELRANVSEMSSSLQSTVAARDELEILLQQITARAETFERRAEEAENALLDAETTLATDRETLEIRLRELASLRRDIAALRQVRRELENEVAGLAAALEEAKLRSQELEGQLKSRQVEFGALRDRAKELEARLASEAERTLLAQKEIEEREVRLSQLMGLYTEIDEELVVERKLSAERQSQIALLNNQIRLLRRELERLAAVLDASESKDRESQAIISDLGRRLNRALAGKVEELSRYRSEFFGRLKEVLGNRRGIRIVGDRFVFQSEVLFASGSAELGEAGQEQMQRLAETLLELNRDIPPELNWVLRVDGHTDRRPINTARFPSNWELSTARAISVVRFLEASGIPSGRLAATGFAEFQPIDDREDEIAFRRNRRIELKLTQR